MQFTASTIFRVGYLQNFGTGEVPEVRSGALGVLAAVFLQVFFPCGKLQNFGTGEVPEVRSGAF